MYGFTAEDSGVAVSTATDDALFEHNLFNKEADDWNRVVPENHAFSEWKPTGATVMNPRERVNAPMRF